MEADFGKTVKMLDRLPIGCRFDPTDYEVITFYLDRKLKQLELPGYKIPEIDNIYEHDPLTITAAHPRQHSTERCWYFFTKLVTTPNSKQIMRTTGEGIWKSKGVATTIIGKDTTIVGTKVTKQFFEYYEGRGKDAISTGWVIKELKMGDNPMVFVQMTSPYYDLSVASL